MWNTLYFISKKYIHYNLDVTYISLLPCISFENNTATYLENLCCNLKGHYIYFLHWYLCSALIFTIFHLIMHINFEMHSPHPHIPSNRPNFPIIKYHTYLTATNFHLCQNTHLWTKFEMYLPKLIKRREYFGSCFFGNLQFIRSFQVFMFLL